MYLSKAFKYSLCVNRPILYLHLLNCGSSPLSHLLSGSPQDQRPSTPIHLDGLSVLSVGYPCCLLPLAHVDPGSVVILQVDFHLQGNSFNSSPVFCSFDQSVMRLLCLLDGLVVKIDFIYYIFEAVWSPSVYSISASFLVIHSRHSLDASILKSGQMFISCELCNLRKSILQNRLRQNILYIPQKCHGSLRMCTPWQKDEPHSWLVDIRFVNSYNLLDFMLKLPLYSSMWSDRALVVTL